MRNFKELIDYIKEVREKTPRNEPNCDIISLESGRLEVFNLAHATKANIYVWISDKNMPFQIEEKENGDITVSPPNGTERSLESCRFKIDDDISCLICLKNLNVDAEIIDMLIRNITNLH